MLKLEPLKDVTTHSMTVLFGNNGVGKTTVIESMPGKILVINVDKGLNSVKNVSEGSISATCENWEDVNEALNMWEDFDSIAIDTIDKLQEFAVAQAMADDGKVYGKGQPQRNHYGTATTYMNALINTLVEVAEQGKNILVLAHDREIEEGDSDSILKVTTVNLMPKVGKYLLSQSRINGFLFREYKDEFNNGEKTQKVVYRGLFGGDPKIATKVTRHKDVKAPDKITDVTWEKVQALLTGKKPEKKEVKK